MSFWRVSGSSTISAIFLFRKSVAALFASGSTPMSLNEANMNRKPLPWRQASSNTASRSSGLTLMAGTGLSSNPKDVIERRTDSR